MTEDKLLNYSFFQMVEVLSKAHGFDLEKMETTHLKDSLFKFATNSGLGFPASEVTRIGIKDHEYFGSQYDIEVNFLGLHGASSPLPGFIVEEIAYESAHNSGIKHLFLDFFNHRLIVFLHKIWRKYRYYAQFKIDAGDRFSKRVFSFIGLDDREFRTKASIEPRLKTKTDELPNWGRLLYFSGMVASRSSSPSIIANIIAHYFELNRVEVQEWQRRLVEIPDWQLNKLGISNCTLGSNFVIGSKVTTYSSKFIICLYDLDIKQFNSFLPTGKNYKIIKTLVSFLLKDQMSYDLRLGLIQKDIPPMTLRKDKRVFLGWSTLIGSNSLIIDNFINIRGAA